MMLALLLGGLSAQALADGPSTLAVQNRLHSQTHEFGAGVGLLPVDAFTKGLTFGGAYTIHFNDLLAWEVGQFTWSYGLRTSLYDDLENLSVGPTPFETVRGFASSNFVFKPIYGKLAVLNRSLVYQELFLVAGGGYGWLTLTGRPLIDVGLGVRIYAGKHFSVRFDARDCMFFGPADVDNEVWLSLGGSLAFGERTR